MTWLRNAKLRPRTLQWATAGVTTRNAGPVSRTSAASEAARPHPSASAASGRVSRRRLRLLATQPDGNEALLMKMTRVRSVTAAGSASSSVRRRWGHARRRRHGPQRGRQRDSGVGPDRRDSGRYHASDDGDTAGGVDLALVHRRARARADAPWRRRGVVGDDADDVVLPVAALSGDGLRMHVDPVHNRLQLHPDGGRRRQTNPAPCYRHQRGGLGPGLFADLAARRGEGARAREDDQGDREGRLAHRHGSGRHDPRRRQRPHLRRADKLYGDAGNDSITPGPGRDTVFGGSGNDMILARDGERDAIDCGRGKDTVVADRADVVKGCEKVRR